MFRGVASSEELRVGETKFWDWLENTEAGRRAGLIRGLPRTHTSRVWKDLGYANTGILTREGIGQSEFMWHCRLLRGVREAFGRIFQVKANELVTSFDGCGAWRNYWLHGGKGSGTITEGNWLVSQNM